MRKPLLYVTALTLALALPAAPRAQQLSIDRSYPPIRFLSPEEIEARRSAQPEDAQQGEAARDPEMEALLLEAARLERELRVLNTTAPRRSDLQLRASGTVARREAPQRATRPQRQANRLPRDTGTNLLSVSP